MRITSLWIENFRSIRSLRLENLSNFNVFYGENGAGKSNILAAIDLLFKAMAVWMEDTKEVTNDKIGFSDSDFTFPEQNMDIRIGVTLIDRVDKAVQVETIVTSPFEFMSISFLINGNTIDKPQGSNRYIYNLSNAYFRLLPAIRSLGTEVDTAPDSALYGADRIAWLLGAGRLKQALVEAVTSPQLNVRVGLKRMQKLFSGPPLHRAPFDPIHDPHRHRYELNEIHETAQGEPYAIPVDFAGLGIQQVYHVMAGIFLGAASVIAVEEPEAHLHPRTSGMYLRELLKRVVAEGHIEQLFIATHSNLFDLDATGYYFVKHDSEKGTCVERRSDFAQLERDVFWEPGPAHYALQDMLKYLPPETIVLRRDDGTAISATQMLGLLQEDHPDAVAFVNDVHATAVRTVQRLANREKRSA